MREQRDMQSGRYRLRGYELLETGGKAEYSMGKGGRQSDRRVEDEGRV